MERILSDRFEGEHPVSTSMLLAQVHVHHLPHECAFATYTHGLHPMIVFDVRMSHATMYDYAEL